MTYLVGPIKNLVLYSENMDMDAHSDIIHKLAQSRNSPNVHQLGMGTQNMICPYSGILFCNKKGTKYLYITILDELDTKDHLLDGFIYRKCPEDKLMGQKVA